MMKRITFKLRDFFFQAEDGIRDSPQSRGLGDVYKRQHNFDVKIHEPNVNILAIQGPLSDDLMAKLFGDEIRQLKFFNFDYFEFKQDKYFVARSGWSKQGGFEVYVENDSAGQKLYDSLFEYGKDLNVKAGCPNLIERIESALLSLSLIHI